MILQHAPTEGQGEGEQGVPGVHVPPPQPLTLVAIEHTPVELLQHAPFPPQILARQVVAGRHVPVPHWY